MRFPQPRAALDVGEQERNGTGRQQGVGARSRSDEVGAPERSQQAHSAYPSLLTQLKTFPQGEDESADLFALRPKWVGATTDRLWPERRRTRLILIQQASS